MKRAASERKGEEDFLPEYYGCLGSEISIHLILLNLGLLDLELNVLTPFAHRSKIDGYQISADKFGRHVTLWRVTEYLSTNGWRELDDPQAGVIY